MRIGAAFPTTEIGSDPAAIRDFVQAVEGLGYAHLTCIDHVVLAAEAEADDWRAYYTRSNPFHEPLVLFAHVAALTSALELATAILILPQRPAVLVAKQLAELDLLSQGRVRAGVGVGWNEIEFEALGQSFRDRGRRMEEQIELMRALWTSDSVRFEGRWHRVDGVGLNPRPVQQPIPVWIGAFEPVAVRRAGRMADGWFVNPRLTAAQAGELVEAFHRSASEAGRDAGGLGIDATVHYGDGDLARIAAEGEAWRRLGATHVTVRTMYSGLVGVESHVEALGRARDALRA